MKNLLRWTAALAFVSLGLHEESVHAGPLFGGSPLGPGALFSLDTTTGVHTLIGSGVGIYALAFDSGVVPEPSSIVLFASAAVWFLIIIECRRRSRKRVLAG